MTIQPIASFTDPKVIHNLTLDKDGWAIDCSCPNHYFAKKRNVEQGLDALHFCKHMNFHNHQKALAQAEQAEQEKRHTAPLNNANKPFSLL